LEKNHCSSVLFLFVNKMFCFSLGRRHTCSSMIQFMVPGSTVNSRWRTRRPFSLVRRQSLFLASGKNKNNTVNINSKIYLSCCFFFFLLGFDLNFFFFNVYSYFWSVETQRRSHGLKLVLSLLLSPLELSLTRARLLLTWRFLVFSFPFLFALI